MPHRNLASVVRLQRQSDGLEVGGTGGERKTSGGMEWAEAQSIQWREGKAEDEGS